MAASRPQPFETRLAIAEERLSGQASEIARLRERMHMVEGDRAAIRLAVGELRRLRKDIPAIAASAAKQAVALADEEREEHTRASHSFHIQVGGFLLALSGWLYALAPRLFH